MQVIDEQDMLIIGVVRPYKDAVFHVIRDTSGVTDAGSSNSRGTLHRYIRIGTYKYVNVTGSTNTIPSLIPKK
jgi:hypothetical protein